MKILALDTATEACSAALLCNGKISELFQIAPQQHTHYLLPMIENLLHQAGEKVGQLDAIAFGRGPGSFTGLRIATSVAQALAFATNLPLIPVSNLLAMAQTAVDELQLTKPTYLISALDARMHEIYWCCYHFNNEHGQLLALAEEQLTSPNNIVLPAQSLTWVGAGNGFANYTATIRQTLDKQLEQILPNSYPRAAAIAKLAAIDFAAGNTATALTATPSYLRNNVAHQSTRINHE